MIEDILEFKSNKFHIHIDRDCMSQTSEIRFMQFMKKLNYKQRNKKNRLIQLKHNENKLCLGRKKEV